jgi:flagellar FliJ protein
MKGFKFKLQPVLDQRQKKEDILKKELAEKRLQYENEKLVLEKLKNKLFNVQQELRIKQKDRIDAVEMSGYLLYCQRLEREIELQVMKLTDLAAEVGRAQERLLEATKEKKIIEKLYDKQLEEFRQEVNRVEQTMIDEISTVRYNRADV